ncbi:MAG: hypothetical protein BGO27_01570 [Alphaproteobacteria bacterium 33-17]|nr:MAG: hypothetical protein BGO27_01570 [Alphaproteobacteria bacterium 33-17]
MKKVLCIDDEKDYCDNIAQILEIEGFNTIKAYSGKDGVDFAMSQMPDVIVCDINMPSTNGFDVLHKLKQNKMTNSIPVIFLTARDHKNDIILSKNSGIEDYLIKPVDFDILLASINSAVSKIVIMRNSMTAVDSGDMEKITKCSKALEHISAIALHEKSDKLIELCDKIRFMLTTSEKKGSILKLGEYQKPEVLSLEDFFEKVKKMIPNNLMHMMNLVFENSKLKIEAHLELYSLIVACMMQHCAEQNTEVFVKSENLLSKSNNYLVVSLAMNMASNTTLKSLVAMLEFAAVSTGAYISQNGAANQHTVNIIFPVAID